MTRTVNFTYLSKPPYPPLTINMITFSHKQRVLMTEGDNRGKTDRQVPTQRQPGRHASLYDVLATTAQQSRERAESVVGTSDPRRQAGFLRELMEITNTLAAKWGVDPRVIPTREIRTVNIIYQKPPTPPKEIADPKPIIRQRPPSDEGEKNQAGNATSEQDPKEHLSQTPSSKENIPEDALVNILSERPLKRALAILRLNRKLSQPLLAELVGVSKSMIEKMERGVREIKPGIVNDICNAMSIPEESLIRQILMKKAIENEQRKRRLRQARYNVADAFDS